MHNLPLRSKTPLSLNLTYDLGSEQYSGNKTDFLM